MHLQGPPSSTYHQEWCTLTHCWHLALSLKCNPFVSSSVLFFTTPLAESSVRLYSAVAQRKQFLLEKAGFCGQGLTGGQRRWRSQHSQSISDDICRTHHCAYILLNIYRTCHLKIQLSSFMLLQQICLSDNQQQRDPAVGLYFQVQSPTTVKCCRPLHMLFKVAGRTAPCKPSTIAINICSHQTLVATLVHFNFTCLQDFRTRPGVEAPTD